jgi:sulfonate transport system ATP-binding protein
VPAPVRETAQTALADVDLDGRENGWPAVLSGGQKHRFTTALITHDAVEAVALANRVLVPREGRIAFDMHIGLSRRRHGSADPAAAALQAAILKEV